MPSAHASLTTRSVALGVVVLLLALLSLRCKSTRTVTIPAQPTTINTQAPDDTTRKAMLPPPEPLGVVTRPEEVIIYRDTTQYTVDLSELVVDPKEEEVTLRTQQDSQTVERRFQMPQWGETFRLFADSQGVQASVQGTPEERQVEASSIEVPWYKQFQRQLRLLVAFVGGLIFGYVAVKLIPGL